MKKEKTKNYNVEFAHVYVNENYNREHFEGSWVAHRFVDEKKGEGEDVSMSILIDDYNPTEKILDVDDFIAKVESNGVKVDFVASEKQLSHYYTILLNSIHDRQIRNNEEKYIFKNGKVPCSFLVAVWYLVRLGKIKVDPDQLFIYRYRSDKPYTADNLYNVLPSRFKAVEERAIELIQSSDFKIDTNDIDAVFF